MNKPSLNYFFPILILFLVLTAFFLLGRPLLVRWSADQAVLLVGNGLLFLLTLISFLLAQRGLASTNPHVFIRSIYGSVMIKLFVCMIAAFAYIALKRQSINKPALFTCMGLYLLYTFLEVGVLTKLLREKKHA